MLRIRVLGRLVVEVDGQAVEPPAAWRSRSLLGWLALHPGAHPRSEVASRFWPDVLDESARASLRNALWALRRDLGEEPFAATRERVGLADDVWVDAREFAQLATAGDAERALALCRGELLEGAEDEWMHEERDAHRERVGELCERLAADAEEGGDASGAVDWSRRRAGLDPLGEEAWRELVRRLAKAGDLPGALAAYERLGERLRDELGIAPSAATRSLVEELRAGATPGTAYVALVPASALAGPFVGREAELAPLRAALERALAGKGAELVAITGEPGIGKTRLAAELAREAHAGGARILQGRCDKEPLAAYQPFLEALGPWVAEAAAEATSRHALFEAVAARLAGMSRSLPVVVLLDDLQWADGPSLALLRHVIVRAPPGRLLVIASYRDTELAAAHPLHQLFADLRRDVPFERVELGGLGLTDVEALAAAMGADPALAARLHADTGGSPFFLTELLRTIAESGHPALPEGVRDVLRARLARLSTPCVALLHAIAVIGRPVEPALAERVAQVDRQGLVEAVDQAISAGLLEEAGGRLALAHALIREAIYGQLSDARRALLHGRAAAALEALHERGSRPPLGELAHHCAEAREPGLLERAVDYAARAAEAATAQLAHEQAVLHYGQALRLLDDGDPRRRPLTMKRAVAFQALSHSRLADAPVSARDRSA
ncbi:MAG: AAA family ATPase [Thermoleophilaceae bacterium]